SRFERLYINTARQGITLWNNAYRNAVRDLTINANAQKGRYGLCLVDSCNLCDVRNVQIQGVTGIGIVTGNSSVGFTDVFAYGGKMRSGLIAKGEGGWVHWVRGMVTDEGQSVQGETCLLFSGLSCVLVEAGGSYSLQYPNPVLSADHVKALTLLSHQLGVKAGCPAALVPTNNSKAIVVQSC